MADKGVVLNANVSQRGGMHPKPLDDDELIRLFEEEWREVEFEVHATGFKTEGATSVDQHSG